ncbi:hypothetical protein Z042_16650 [Chania multitudinisentens RB-25]|uniref:Uncharacterized protein n=2 Tax=Chania TaxID=1745211 RepID=W0LKF3_9GAMM|nr:hypothetical protein Z042_16650 [Chania multitudinisentens RB-25]
MKVKVWNDRLDILSTSTTTPNIIYGSGWVTVNISTANNGAYPGLFIRHREYHTSGMVDLLSWAFPNKTGSCYTGASIETNPPDTIEPIDKLEPPEPEFKLNSAVWELNTVDVEDLPDVAAVGNGYQATIKNIASNNFCVSYATAGVKDKAYALSVTNSASQQGGRNLFMMQNGSSQLPYNLQLSSNDGVTGNDFDFPTATAKYINLSQAASSVDKRSEMCWTPKINLFKNASTSEGMHSETLNFIITPKA